MYLDLHSGEVDQNSDKTYLLVRGPADFAEEVTRLLSHHGIFEVACASRTQIERARESLTSDQLQIDDDAIVSRGHQSGGVWLSAWLWLPDEAV